MQIGKTGFGLTPHLEQKVRTRYMRPYQWVNGFYGVVATIEIQVWDVGHRKAVDVQMYMYALAI